MKKLMQITASIAMGGGTLVWGIQQAYQQRGYQAIGGEYILAVLAAIVIYWLIDKMEWR